MRFALRFALQSTMLASLAIAGCDAGPAADNPLDMRAPAIPWPASIAGRWATVFSLDLDPTTDGGTRPDPLRLLALFSGIQKPSGEVDTSWTLCTFNYPNLAPISDDLLDPWLGKSKSGHIVGPTDGAIWTQPTVAIVVGAQLADPTTDALPIAGTKRCADAQATGCVVHDLGTNKPGVALAASGLTPDADILYVDMRVTWAFSATYEHLGILNGTVASASIESHVLGCHLRSGAECSPDDAAHIEKMHPPINIKSGSLRWRAQGPYFTCPTFEMDPEGALSGTESPSLDAGLPGASSDGGDMGTTSKMSFSDAIQNDIDNRGCATIGCHESITRSGAMHLIFRPKTPADVRANYEAVLPWTIADGTGPGGRFSNQVPVPAPMKQRWIDWIAAGSPF